MVGTKSDVYYVLFSVVVISMANAVSGSCQVSGHVVKDCEWSPWALDCSLCCENMGFRLALRSRSTCCQGTISTTGCLDICNTTSLTQSVLGRCSRFCRSYCMTSKMNSKMALKSKQEIPSALNGFSEGNHGNSIYDQKLVIRRQLLAVDDVDDMDDCGTESNCKFLFCYLSLLPILIHFK